MSFKKASNIGFQSGLVPNAYTWSENMTNCITYPHKDATLKKFRIANR